MLKNKFSYEPQDWNNWKFQLKNSIRNASQMAEWVNLTDKEKKAIDAVDGKYRWIVTPYYASIMNPDDENCPVRL